MTTLSVFIMETARNTDNVLFFALLAVVYLLLRSSAPKSGARRVCRFWSYRLPG